MYRVHGCICSCCVPVEVCGCVQKCMCLGDVYALGAHRLSSCKFKRP